MRVGSPTTAQGMQHLDLILTLTGGLSAALLFGFVMHRLGLSPLAGYLLAGIAVGPYTPGFVAHGEIARGLSEIGVTLLMFGVGLQFHVEELLAVRRFAVPGALTVIAGTTTLGTLAAQAWGFPFLGALVFGLSLSVASTVVLVRVLADLRALHTARGRLAMGWLVVEDVSTVIVLVALPVIVSKDTDGSSVATSLALAGLKLAGLVLALWVFGRRAIPRLFEYVAATRSRELFTLTVLVTALGIAVLSSQLFGASMALGALLAGMVVGQSDFSARAGSEALPMRDAFAVLFFVAMGMLFDPAVITRAPAELALTLAIVLIGKPLFALLALSALGKPLRFALPVAVGFAQIGEFSFVLAGLGETLGVLPPQGTSTLVAVALVAMTLNPLLVRRASTLVPAHGEAGELEAQNVTSEAEDRAVIVGFGPTGETIARILQDNGIEPLVIELNLETVRALRARGMRAVYGDARQREILEQAGVDGAIGLFLTAPEVDTARATIRAAKEIDREIRIYARSTYARDTALLEGAGADAVLSDERELALAMATTLLVDLGATPDQIDRERHRVHEWLLRRTV